MSRLKNETDRSGIPTGTELPALRSVRKRTENRMAYIIDGKEISAKIRAELKKRTEELGIRPGLAVVLVGDDPASQIYVRNKHRACGETGIYSEVYTLPAETRQEDLEELIGQLNESPQIHGILVQLPLPKHLDALRVIEKISPEKDVDAFHPVNVGRLMTGCDGFLPCTPAGVIELLKRSGVALSGKRAVVLGRSNIVGKPLAMLLLRENATVTVCHSRTENLKQICREADILVSAIGRAEFVTGDMIKPGAAVIDVGMNRNAEGKLCGDVNFREAKQVAGYITPVPGGVGPMTITMLLENTVRAAERSRSKQS